MVHGRKHAEESAGIRTSRPLAAAVLLLVAGAWATALARAYDPATQSTTIPGLGARLQLGDADEGHGQSEGDRRHDRDDDD